jgi:hypothetical protein
MRNLAKVLTFVAPLLALTMIPSYAQAAGPFQYHPVTPCRVVDTRPGGPQAQAGIMTSLQDRTFQVQGFGTCGVPNGAKAVSLNVTAVSPTAQGFLTLYPNGIANPGVSTINFVAGDIVANGAIVPLGTAGLVPNADLRVFAGTGGTVHVIIDVSGYFQ